MGGDRRLCGKLANASQCIKDRFHEDAHLDPQGRSWPNEKRLTQTTESD